MKTTDEIIQQIKHNFEIEDRLFNSYLKLKEQAEEMHHWKDAQMYDNEASEHQAKKMELCELLSFITGDEWMTSLKVLYGYRD